MGWRGGGVPLLFGALAATGSSSGVARAGGALGTNVQFPARHTGHHQGRELTYNILRVTPRFLVVKKGRICDGFCSP